MKFDAFLAESSIYQNTPLKPDEAEMEAAVALLRSGDASSANWIIEQHLRITMSIVASMAHPSRSDELVGEALFALTHAVKRTCPRRLKDNLITPYLCSTVRWKLKEFITRDRLFGVPSRTLRNSKKEIVLPTLFGNMDDFITEDQPLLDVVELLQQVPTTPREQALLELTSDGHSRSACADILHISRPLVTWTLKRMERRFDELVLCSWAA